MQTSLNLDFADVAAKDLPPAATSLIASTDPSWQPTLLAGLQAINTADPSYLPTLATTDYLPTEGRLFAAFKQPLDAVRYVLVGEGPYPRAQSATGVCFMDGAVGSLWSDGGLSKAVNRATSLRNFMKMLLVAAGHLQPDATSGTAIAAIAQQAQADSSEWIQTLAQLQANLTRHGFLLLNAALVFRPDVAPMIEAKAWRPFLQTVLQALAEHAKLQNQPAPTLVLWGKVAELLRNLPVSEQFPHTSSEHPYNLTFIVNQTMQGLFGPMNLLRTQS